MPVPFPFTHRSGADFALSGSPDEEGCSDLIGPMLAGAQARGVADTFELLGIGAALIDATGKVLHMGVCGRNIVVGWLRVVEDHLVADRPSDNKALQTLIGAAIDGSSEDAVPVRLEGRETGILKIRALRMPRSHSVNQLLRAVLVFEELTAA